MDQPASIGEATVRTRDGQTFTGRTVAVPAILTRLQYLAIATRPAAGEITRVPLDNVAEVIAR